MKIILHIGNGKTGTTSIQDSLAGSTASLEAHGIAYVGHMLERAPVRAADWQRKGVNPNATMAELARLDVSEAQAQIVDALRQNIEKLSSAGAHTLIWSNERFFRHPNLFVTPLRELASEGHDVEIVAYVRRHDSWAKSVHNQWHLKRKRRKGKTLPFRKFMATFTVAYAPSLRRWDAAFGETLKLRNFDAVGDVVDDFCETIGIDRALVTDLRSNDTPGPEETVLRVLFNDRLAEWAPELSRDPIAFERIMRPRQIDFDADPVAMTNDVLPSDDDLREVLEATAADRDEVNRMLQARGAHPLASTPKPVRPVSVDDGLIDSVLFQLVMRQARELNQLRVEVSRLKQRLDDQG